MNNGWVAAVLLLVVGCGGGDDDERLEQQQSVWEAKQPSEYTIAICETGSASGCSLEAVSNQQVVAARSRVGTGAWTDLEPAGREDPVKALFRRARSSSGCERTRLTFDGQFGFPSDVYFDCGEEGSGEAVRCFVPGTVDLSTCSAP